MAKTSDIVYLIHSLQKPFIREEDPLVDEFAAAKSQGVGGSSVLTRIIDGKSIQDLHSRREIKRLKKKLLSRHYGLFAKVLGEVETYDTDLVRLALTTHYAELQREDSSSDVGCFLLDLDIAIAKLAPEVKVIINLLREGYIASEIGQKLELAQPWPAVNAAIKALTEVMNGKQ